MNAGFSNLDWLKKQLLAKSVQTDTRFDAMILAIGQGVASAFEQYCSRKFLRTVNVQEIHSADRVQFSLTRYPLESLSLVELKVTEADGWQQLDAPPWNALQTIDLPAGLVNFPEDDDVGPYYAQVRFTFTGGFFWETLEPSDPNFPSQLPTGANALPADLLKAWLTQCRKEWEAIDKVGDKLLSVGSNTKNPSEALAGLDLVPVVEETLKDYIRMKFV